MTSQTFKIAPTTTLGKWSLGLIVVMPLLFVIGTTLASTLYQSTQGGNTILEDIAARPALALTMLAGMAMGITAFVLGLIAILKQKDYAILVIVATVIGALLILFLAGEFLSPH